MAQVSARFTEWLALYRAAKARGLSADDADEAADAALARRQGKQKGTNKHAVVAGRRRKERSRG